MLAHAFHEARTALLSLSMFATLADAQCTPGWRERGNFGTLNGTVFALTVWDAGNGPELYAGGYFTSAGSTAVNHVARWDGVSWHALGSGTDDAVYCFFEYDGELIIGGRFTTAGGAPANRIAAWNGSSWRNLGTGLNSKVYALGELYGELWVGGWFTSAGGIPAQDLAVWDGVRWHVYDLVFDAPLPVPGVHAFLHHDDYLIVGGEFQSIDGVPAYGLARFRFAWDNFGVTLAQRPAVHALRKYNGNLFVGGYDYLGGGVIDPLLKWYNGSAWGEPWEAGVNQYMAVWALEVVNGLLIVGGYVPPGYPNETLVGWDGARWRFLGFGGAPRTAYAIAKFEGDLVVGGDFSDAGGVPASNIARYACPPCLVDFDNDGFVTGIDFDLFVQAFEAGNMNADFDNDGFLTGIDFDLYVLAYEAGC
jgi:hypothetical protein